MTATLRAAIIGVTGYVGSELARIILQHPNLTLAAVYSRNAAGQALGDVVPALAGFTTLRVELLDLASVAAFDVVFVATPHGIASTLIPEIIRHGDPLIVDMSADHRHKKGWVYAQPEWAETAIVGANRLAIPGCFATALSLSIAPMVAKGLCAGPVCASGVTGSTGSGVQPKRATHHPERFVNLKAYKVLEHQHIPEVGAFLTRLGVPPDVYFVPHSGPFDRGIFTTCFIPTENPESAIAAYDSAYGEAPFVRRRESSPELRWVRGTAFCDLSVKVAGSHVVVLAAIDNLGRGAACQGIQAFNISRGWAASTGLWSAAVTP